MQFFAVSPDVRQSPKNGDPLRAFLSVSPDARQSLKNGDPLRAFLAVSPDVRLSLKNEDPSSTFIAGSLDVAVGRRKIRGKKLSANRNKGDPVSLLATVSRYQPGIFFPHPGNVAVLLPLS